MYINRQKRGRGLASRSAALCHRRKRWWGGALAACIGAVLLAGCEKTEENGPNRTYAHDGFVINDWTTHPVEQPPVGDSTYLDVDDDGIWDFRFTTFTHPSEIGKDTLHFPQITTNQRFDENRLAGPLSWDQLGAPWPRMWLHGEEMEGMTHISSWHIPVGIAESRYFFFCLRKVREGEDYRGWMLLEVMDYEETGGNYFVRPKEMRILGTAMCTVPGCDSLFFVGQTGIHQRKPEVDLTNSISDIFR